MSRTRSFAASIGSIPQMKPQNLNQILNLKLFSCLPITTSICIHPNQIAKLHNIFSRRLITSFHSPPIVTSSWRFSQPCCSVSVMSQNNDTIQDSTKTVKCVIKGRVQGVFYRNWTIENATQLNLNGWVRNRRDGSVEAIFSGKSEAVDEMMQRCRRGPPDAMVTAFQANPCNEDAGTGFERRPTV